MAATLGLVLDCADPDTLAAFWSEALGYTNPGGAGSYLMLVDADGTQPKLLLQRVTSIAPRGRDQTAGSPRGRSLAR